MAVDLYSQGISPHSLLCMEPALWRQQIVDHVTFDLSKECIQIALIDSSKSLYSFAECQQILDLRTLQPESTPASGDPLSSKIKPALFSHLDPLLSFLQQNKQAATDLNQLCRMSSYQLAILKKKIRPYPLTPTTVQVALDERSAKQRKAKPISIKKSSTRKKSSSCLGTPSKSRKRIKSAPTPESESTPSQLPEVMNAFHLGAKDLHRLVYHLSAYRSTLVDLFQSVVLPILRAELPQLYSLWVLESQIQSHRKLFREHSIQFAKILLENEALENYQHLYSMHHRHRPDLLRDLKEWCQATTAPHSCEQDHLSSADTSLNEQSSIHQTTVKTPLFSPRSSMNLEYAVSKDEKTVSQDALPALPVTPIWPGISASPSVPLSDNLEVEPITLDSDYRVRRERTPSLSPPPEVSSESRLATHSNLHLPILILEKSLLSSIKPENERQLAIEIVIKLAEQRLEIDKMLESYFILKLLDEERDSRDQFSGISRLSDIITTSRLAAGVDGSEANIAQYATIKGALAGSKPASVDDSAAQDTPSKTSYRPPSKTSELKRRQCIKRKTWLAATRRLDSRLVGQQEQHSPGKKVWPEPIFLKNSNRRKRKDETSAETSSNSKDGPSSSDVKRSKRGGQPIEEILEIVQDGKPSDAVEAVGQVVWVKLNDDHDPGSSDPILVSAPASGSGTVDIATGSPNKQPTNGLVNQGIIAELSQPVDHLDPPNSSSQIRDEGLEGGRSDELTIENLKLFTQNDKVFESLTGECSNENLSEVDSEWPR
ncbi:hypothetical protein PtB15_2B897 [Puccinia triticina]|nr:hypothetical protein PtB15_2B897 [Puccinia triticina]